MKINVFDTPGFSDAEITNIRKNKLLIASSLKNNIDMIVFISPNPRFDQNNQLSLEMLNEWTSGKMWNNLIIAKARTEFLTETVNSRMLNDNTYGKMKDASKIIRFLMKRQHLDRNNAWNVTELVDGTVESHALTAADFKQLEISLINMAQHRECYESPDHPISPNCWKMPSFDEHGSYEYDYDEEYNEVIQFCKLA